MKLSAILVLGITAILCAGCDRGSHPRMIGSPAPDFTVKDSDRTVALHDFRGKTVLLNFWASWCGPCIEETPSLIDLHKELGNRVTILAVSLDDSDSAYHQFLVNHHFDVLTVRDASKRSSELYGTTGYPETFVIDSSGVIRRKFVGPTNWMSPDIVEYLKKLSPA